MFILVPDCCFRTDLKIVSLSFKKFTGGFCEYDMWHLRNTYIIMAIMVSVIVINVVLKRAFTIPNVYWIKRSCTADYLYWSHCITLYHLFHISTVNVSDVTDLISFSHVRFACSVVGKESKDGQLSRSSLSRGGGYKIQLLLYVNGLCGLYWALHSHTSLIVDCTIISHQAQPVLNKTKDKPGGNVGHSWDWIVLLRLIPPLPTTTTTKAHLSSFTWDTSWELCLEETDPLLLCQTSQCFHYSCM